MTGEDGFMEVEKTKKRADSLVNLAYEQIKEDLARGYFKPGEKIVFRELVERYAISETPIKQALNRLVTEGLVESIPRRGMRICERSPSDFKETLDIRYILEDYFAPVVMETISFHTDILERMKRNVQRQYDLIQQMDQVETFMEYYRLDHEFHSTYIKWSGNHRAMQVYEGIGAHSFGNFLYHKKPKEKFLSGTREHEMIVEALEAQDLDALRKAIRVHVDNGKASIDYMRLGF